MEQQYEDNLAAQSRAIEQSYRSLVRSGHGYSGRWSGAFAAPCPGPIISPFGMRFHPILHYYRMHTGVDIGAGYGSPIHAAAPGIVAMAGNMRGYGNVVIVEHGGEGSTVAAPLAKQILEAALASG